MESGRGNGGRDDEEEYDRELSAQLVVLKDGEAARQLLAAAFAARAEVDAAHQKPQNEARHHDAYEYPRNRLGPRRIRLKVIRIGVRIIVERLLQEYDER